MKKLICLLLVLVVLSLYGCTVQTSAPEDGAQAPGSEDIVSPEIEINPAAETDAILSDIDSIAEEAAGIDTSDLDAIMPISEADLDLN